MLNLGIVSDEISADFKEAIHYGLKWGIKRYEIRMLKSGRVPLIDNAEAAEIYDLIKAHQLKITAVSPGIFKRPVSDKSGLKEELNIILPKTIDFARTIGSPLIIVFGFKQNAENMDSQRSQAVEVIQKAAKTVADAGLTLAIENEPGFICDTGKNTAKFIEHVNHSAVKSNWDPCNSYGTAEVPYPEGYLAVKKYIANVHAKDTKRGGLVECLPLGEGNIDWEGQLKALLRDRIVPHITIETHCLPLVEQSEKNVRYIRNLLSAIPEK